ncbi:MAG: hypothetical protein Q9O74_02200 [Planctomycetota bacterium]|nr:hypothetical protein [Planctomycetota bacterium]
MAIQRLGHRVFVICFFAAPLVVLVVLAKGILVAFERGPAMVAEPIGAGAGQTGGANAIGQLIFGTGDPDRGIPAERAPRGVELVVRDETGLATTNRPILLLTNHDRFDVASAVPFVLQDTGEWLLHLPPPESEPGQEQTLAFRIGLRTIDGLVMLEQGADGRPAGVRRLPRVTEQEAVGDSPLRYRFVVRSFAEPDPTPDPG